MHSIDPVWSNPDSPVRAAYKLTRWKFPGVPHTAILFDGDWGANFDENGEMRPVLAELLPGGVQISWFNPSLGWNVTEAISEDQFDQILFRVERAMGAGYAVSNSNCQHFANFVARGEWRSETVEAVGTVVKVVAFGFLLRALFAPSSRGYRGI